MTSKSRKSLFLSLIVLAPPALACVWPYQQPAYWREYPAGPERDAFFAGEVGILDNDWTDAGLFVAWRHLQGLGLPKESWQGFRLDAQAAEEAEMLAMAVAEPVAEPAEEAPSADAVEAAEGAETETPAEPAEELEPPPYDAVGRWNAAVKRAFPEAELPWVSSELAGDVPDGKGGTQWLYFLNCLDPAFDTAAAALDQRAARWGKDSKELAEWLRGQHQVFANCGQLAESPAELDAAWPAELRADRQYQIAAADLYGMRYAAAGDRFRQIAADKSSPWAATAAFAAARATLRAGSYARAIEELRAVAANPALAEFHASAGRLVRYAELRDDQERAAARLEGELGAKGKLPAEAPALLYDARWMASKLEPKPERPLIYFLQSVSSWKVPAADVYAAWKAKPAPASLVVALLRADEAWQGNDAGREDAEPAAEGDVLFPKAETAALVDAAAKVQKGSPAYLSARYYRASLLARLGRTDEARQELDRLLAELSGQGAQRSDVQRLRHLRAHVARDWKELVEFGLIEPLGETDDQGSRVYAVYAPSYNEELAGDARLLIPVASLSVNRFASLAEIAELQRLPALPAHYRRDLALAGFLRAALQEKNQEAAAFADAAVAVEAGLAPLFEEWRQAEDADRKKLAAALLALRQPGLSIDLWADWGRITPREEMDSSRGNWWCDVTDLPKLDQRPTFLLGKDAPEDAAFGWLSGPNHLGSVVLDYAKKHPDDPRLPEALHRTVRATRYGCFGSSFAEVSKGAFTLLHKRFPKSEWAAKTKYWFE